MSSGTDSRGLTPRQEMIRTLLRQGMSNKVIGAKLGISEGTVKNHISEIFRVLKVSNRTQAAHTGAAEKVGSPPQTRELADHMYDLEEYLHLALHANAKRDPHACIGYLKEALRVDPRNAKAIYLLAIQHAEIGLIDRGIAGLTKVLSVEPTFEMARLQLGLLLLDRHRTTEARELFAMSRASADPALRALAEGLALVADGHTATAAEKIRAGLAIPASNPSLQVLARGVLARLEQMPAAAHPPGKESAHAESDRRLFMGAYESAKPSG